MAHGVVKIKSNKNWTGLTGITGLRIKRRGLKEFVSPATLRFTQVRSSSQRSQRDRLFLDRFF
jgi:hypothetical protein